MPAQLQHEIDQRILALGFTPYDDQPAQSIMRTEAAAWHGACHQNLPAPQELFWVSGTATIDVFTEMSALDWKGWFATECEIAHRRRAEQLRRYA